MNKRVIGVSLILVSATIFIYMAIMTDMKNQPANDPEWPPMLRGTSFSGRITGLTGDFIEIEMENGRKERFRLNEGTRIMLQQEDLKEGLYVRIISQDTKKEKIAKVIRTVRNPDEENAEPDMPSESSPTTEESSE